jgi:putative endonuclease
MATKDILGRSGEQVAARYLNDVGYRLIERNWRCARGEIDIIAIQRSTLVFCEVKTRSSNRYGSPLEAITPGKTQRLRTLALTWLGEHRGSMPNTTTVRFDVIGILRVPGGRPLLRHVEGAF